MNIKIKTLPVSKKLRYKKSAPISKVQAISTIAFTALVFGLIAYMGLKELFN